MVDHHLQGLVAGEEAVLDAVDPGADARLDGGVADGVRGHPHAARCASSAMAANSASEYRCAPGEVLCDITPPEAETLINLAPCRIW